MVLTKAELLNTLQKESRILAHLADKVEPSMVDYRPTPKQRSSLELLRYMTIMGPQLIGAAKAGSTKCLVAFTTTGATARRLSRERPLQPVLALSPEINAVRRMALCWGVEPRVSAQPDSLEVVTTDASNKALELGLVAPGERLLVVAGTPFGAPGAANLLRLAHAPGAARRR